jgi:hypothetical protein
MRRIDSSLSEGQTARGAWGALLSYLDEEPPARVEGASRPSRLAPFPIEPSEPSELSAPSWPERRLYGDDDGAMGNRDETKARAKALGITTPLFEEFSCILAGHHHKARLHFTRLRGSLRGFWQYSCPDLDGSFGLGEVRAFVAYGATPHLSNVEAARWRELLDFEAQLRLPVELDVRVPERCPEAARIVAERMCLLVGLRDARWPPDEAFIFAREFAKAYCGLSDDRVRVAVSWLERAGVTYRDGKHGHAIRWKLHAQDEFVARGHNGDRVSPSGPLRPPSEAADKAGTSPDLGSPSVPSPVAQAEPTEPITAVKTAPLSAVYGPLDEEGAKR